MKFLYQTMHIHELIIDGFKSYASRTVVSGFDPHFNAITGLNGSGKSNILDAICFVLGISNLSQVRVGNLQELVYKQGQAGVTKATVTIVFDNSDPSTSPIGHESSKQLTVTRQIAIGGKNKYMINGHTVQQQQVQNLFHSVQLNVNNPHFLIMQGRITKVLNMKPMEILSMIEEAAGTRMFETKKQAALKTIEKKQAKVEELTKVMNTEIVPTLDKLRSERQNYNKWTSNKTEIDRLERLVVAYDYQEAVSKASASEEDKLKIVRELEHLENEQKECKNEISLMDGQINALLAQRNGELEDSLLQKKKVADAMSKDLVKMDSAAKNQQETLASEKETIATLKKQVEGAGNQLAQKQSELAAATEKVVAKEAEVESAEKETAALQNKFQNALAGVADETTADTLSLPEQVRTWEAVARDSETKMKQINLKSEHVKTELKAVSKDAKTENVGYKNMLAESEQLESDIKQAGTEIVKLNKMFNIAEEPVIRKKAEKVSAEINTMTNMVDTLTAMINAKLAFEFKDPVKGFNRSSVKGLVAKLVTVKDQRAATALEIAAGSKLFQVVVDNDQTGKLLIEKGQLQKRVTILPLNKISPRTMDPTRLSAAKELAKQGNGSAQLGLELVGYDDEIKKAIEYVFGNVIVCDTAAVAQSITFNKTIAAKTVTLDGDVYEAGGTMSGGSKNNMGQLLSSLTELATASDAVAKLKIELKSLEATLLKLENASSGVKEMESAVELKTEALKMLKDKLSATTYAQTVEKIKALEGELTNYQEELVLLQGKIKEAQEKLKTLRSSEKDVKKARETAMKEMERDIKSSQKIVSKLRTELTKLKHERVVLQGQMDSIRKETEQATEQIANAGGVTARMEAEVDDLKRKASVLRAQYETASLEVSSLSQEIQRCNKEIKHMEKVKDKCVKTIQSDTLEAKKLEHKLEQWKKDSVEASRRLKQLVKQHTWIDTDKQHFGVPGSDYEFPAGEDVKSTRSKLGSLNAEQDKLSKKINKKVIGMIEKAESEADELGRKKQVVLNDKSKIEAVIAELDVKKQQELQTTWLKVNRDFGSIFSTLLPGTHAKLEPLEGKEVGDGLEVKVAFNNVWKDSLTELSGGQRSLLALSLILSLLLFKPAPMYILDEVDAALDLSHTQNIGLMLRTHFSHSQFVVVSLKEGMFNNANVIFRTRFVDGISGVSRTVVGGKSSAPLAPHNPNVSKGAVANKKSKTSKGPQRSEENENESVL